MASVCVDEVLPASWKADLNGEEWHAMATSSEDIFVDADDATHDGFNHVAKRLFDSS